MITFETVESMARTAPVLSTEREAIARGLDDLALAIAATDDYATNAALHEAITSWEDTK